MIHLRWDEAAHWLFLEGMLPLLGAGIVYLLMGGALYVAAPPKSAFKFAWKESIDPLGWLYGAAIIAVQAGWTAHSHNFLYLSLFCFAAGGGALIQLFAGLTYRGGDPTWHPPLSLKIFAALLVVVVLAAGYSVHTHGGVECPCGVSAGAKR